MNLMEYKARELFTIRHSSDNKCYHANHKIHRHRQVRQDYRRRGKCDYIRIVYRGFGIYEL